MIGNLWNIYLLVGCSIVLLVMMVAGVDLSIPPEESNWLPKPAAALIAVICVVFLWPIFIYEIIKQVKNDN